MDEKMKSAIQGIGATAEMSIIFYRAAISTGATTQEATRTTQAYIAALFDTARRQEQERRESDE